MSGLAQILAAIPALCRPPPDAEGYNQLLCTSLLIFAKPPLDPMLDVRKGLASSETGEWIGEDVFSNFEKHPYSFYEVTGETPDSLTAIVPFVLDRSGHRHKLSPRNRVLLFVLWLRSYPSYHFLSFLFKVSSVTIGSEIRAMVIAFHAFALEFIKWPSQEEWRSYRNCWPELPGAVGAIDGTSIEIYRPEIEPQVLYYSGYRHYHVIQAQVICDNRGKMRLIECGFLGHQNDAQQFNMMDRIGVSANLPFPLDCFILGDKIYRNEFPIITPYTRAQITRKPANLPRKCLKLNKEISKRRICIEHCIGELKCYKVLSSLWRHRRNFLRNVAEICCGLVCKRKYQYLI